MLHIQFAALALAAISLAAGGCGGSSKSDTTTTSAATTLPATTATATTAVLPPAKPVKVATGTPLTRTQFIAKADAICARSNTKVDTVTIVSKSEINRAFPQAAVYEGTETNELTKLVPPTTMAQDWGQIISDFHRYLEYANAAARYAEAKNAAAILPLLKPAEAVHEHLNVIARRDGFKDCSGVR